MKNDTITDSSTLPLHPQRILYSHPMRTWQ